MPNDSAFDIFCQHSSHFIFPPETPLLRQDQVINEIFFLVKGAVKLTRIENGGDEMITGLRTAGKLVGAASAIANNPSPMTATTLTQCEGYRLPANKFIRLIETDAEFARYVLDLISQQQHEYLLRYSQISMLKAPARLALLLLEFSRDLTSNKNGELCLQLPLKDADVASMLAIDPAYLSRIFSRMAKDGVIRKSGGWIYIPDVERLKQEVSGGSFRRGGAEK